MFSRDIIVCLKFKAILLNKTDFMICNFKLINYLHLQVHVHTKVPGTSHSKTRWDTDAFSYNSNRNSVKRKRVFINAQLNKCYVQNTK